jgi:hypothetical protein
LRPGFSGAALLCTDHPASSSYSLRLAPRLVLNAAISAISAIFAISAGCSLLAQVLQGTSLSTCPALVLPD